MSKSFKVLGINHVGLAPKHPEVARSFLADLLSLSFHGDELVKEQQTLTSMFASSSADGPGPRLEILAAHDGAGPIAAFLEKKGSGVHHLALQVDSIDNALIYLKEKQVRLIDEQPRAGAHNTRIAFIHPAATGGLLIELVEEAP